MQRSFASIVVFTLIAFISTDALAKRRKPKKQKKGAPVSVKIKNTCKQDIGIKIGKDKFKVPAGKSSPGKTLSASDSTAYKYNFGHSKRGPGHMFFEFGGKYAIKIHRCTKTWASLSIRNLAPKPKSVSPNAASIVRFRAGRAEGERVPNLEYRTGARGRFKRMSVGRTKPVEAAAGQYKYGLRLKAGRMGPVLQMFNGTVKLEPGKSYLIEAGVVNGQIYTKFEDEGYTKPKKR